MLRKVHSNTKPGGGMRTTAHFNTNMTDVFNAEKYDAATIRNTGGATLRINRTHGVVITHYSDYTLQ